MRRVELAAFAVPLRAQRRLTGRAPRQTGATAPRPPPAGPGRRWRVSPKQGAGARLLREGASGRRSPAHPRPRTSGGSGVRGEAVPSAALGAQRPPRGPLSLSRAVTSFCLERPPARLEQSARGLGQRGHRLDNRTRTPSPRPIRAARTPADGTDTSRAAMPSDGRRCQGVRVRHPGPGLSLSKPRIPNKSTARPASKSHVPRGFRWERSRPVPPCSASSEFGAVLTPASGLSFGPKKSPAALAEGPWGRRGGPKPRQCWVLMGNARETTVVMVSRPRPATWSRLLRVALLTWLNSYFLLQD